jgi:signal transduction histidine kinase
MTGLTHHRRTPRGFLFGAALAALAFLVLGVLVGNVVRTEEEQAFSSVTAWAHSTVEEVFDAAATSVEHQGARLIDGRQIELPEFVRGIVAWDLAQPDRSASVPRGYDIAPGSDTPPRSGRLSWTGEGYRFDVLTDSGPVAADFDVEGLLDEVERLSVGLIGVALLDPERDTIVGEATGPAHFQRTDSVIIKGRELQLLVVAGPSAAVSGRDPIVGTFFAMGLICAALVLAIGRSTAGRISDSEHRAELLEEISAGKDRFIASVSHELRTPLAAIQGFSMELTDTIFDPVEHLEIARVIAEQSQEMGLLVEDLLVAGRVDAGTIVVQAEAMSLVDAIAAGVAVISVPENKHVSLTIQPIWASGDPLRVRQVVRNLLTNAIRYGGNNIEVVVRSEGGVAILEVIDDGPGIEVEDPSVVFQPYYRLSDAKTMPASVGLGLTVARDLAELMGGSLTYKRVDVSTVFRLELEQVETPDDVARPIQSTRTDAA